MLIAIPSADAALVRELSEVGVEAGLQVRVLPPSASCSTGEWAKATSVRSPRPTCSAVARSTPTSPPSRATSPGGACWSPAPAVRSARSFVDRSRASRPPRWRCSIATSPRSKRCNSRSKVALLDSRQLIVADLRDRERLDEVFAEHQPEVVFHAAALKHLPLLQLHPEEGVKTNVLGTLNALEVSVAHGVTRFVNVSTDKAADPTSVLGYTKRITERLSATADDFGDGTYISVRFGNVLGSRGSVLTTFRAQISAGGPVTVTHPDVSRYFMTIEEAVQLVIQAGAIGDGGEVLVLEMGDQAHHGSRAPSDRAVRRTSGDRLHRVYETARRCRRFWSAVPR